MSSYRPLSLAEVISERLRDDILTGSIAKEIPGENCLAKDYSVARTTIRTALKKLEGEGVITPAFKGKNRMVIQGANRENAGAVRILAPSDLADMDNYTRAYVRAIRRGIASAGMSVKISPKGYSTLEHGVDKYLTTIVKQFPADCWILIMPSAEVGAWFVDNEINCVACGGSPLEGLPRVCHDAAALLRHALHSFFRNGHERVLTLTRWRRLKRFKLIGEIFHEADVPFFSKVNIFCYENDSSILRQELLQLLTLDAGIRPTAFLVPDSRAVAVVYSVCLELGVRIPEDLSLVVFYGDSMIQNFYPSPCSYVANIEELSREMLKLVMQKLKEPETLAENKVLLMEYRKGGSLRNLSEANTS